jgi:hypothetical protein
LPQVRVTRSSLRTECWGAAIPSTRKLYAPSGETKTGRRSTTCQPQALPDQPQRRAVLRNRADLELVRDASVVAGHIRGVFEALKSTALAAALAAGDGASQRGWWRRGDSNPLPQRCERCALPDELRPLANKRAALTPIVWSGSSQGNLGLVYERCEEPRPMR